MKKLGGTIDLAKEEYTMPNGRACRFAHATELCTAPDMVASESVTIPPQQSAISFANHIRFSASRTAVTSLLRRA